MSQMNMLYQARASLLSLFSLDHKNLYNDEWKSSSDDLFLEHFYIKLPSHLNNALEHRV